MWCTIYVAKILYESIKSTKHLTNFSSTTPIKKCLIEPTIFQFTICKLGIFQGEAFIQNKEKKFLKGAICEKLTVSLKTYRNHLAFTHVIWKWILPIVTIANVIHASITYVKHKTIYVCQNHHLHMSKWVYPTTLDEFYFLDFLFYKFLKIHEELRYEL